MVPQVAESLVLPGQCGSTVSLSREVVKKLGLPSAD